MVIIVRYVFLDRDGVLNRKMPEGDYVTGWAQFQWLPGAIEAIARMHRAGLTLILVTNQRGVALGRLSIEGLELIHRNLQADLARHGARLDAVYYCPHDKNECRCRKPDTGLFEQALRDFPQMAAGNSLVIGDSISDIEAGRRLGMKTIFIQNEPERQKPGAREAAALADASASSLLEAAELVLRSWHTGSSGSPDS
ncbi:MAG TPA: HAD family hydrolase [Acidobacteriaceae bacterium]|nr:HAD family hydrolase [Acidobacteriaceae bacterium]